MTTASAVALVHGGSETVHLSVIGPVPLVCVKVALGALASLKVPAPPLTTDHMPVIPSGGVLPPSPEVVPLAQMACAPPAVAVGCAFMVIVTSAVESVQGGFDIVHLNTTGPAPLV